MGTVLTIIQVYSIVGGRVVKPELAAWSGETHIITVAYTSGSASAIDC